MPEPPIDTCLRQETPEGVELSLSPAGPVVRAAAWVIDLALRGIVYAATASVSSLLGGAGTSLLLVGMFLLEWGYPVFFEASSGATPGKRVFGLVVVHDDGSPLSFGSAVVRNLIRFVDFLPFGYVVGLGSCLISNRFQRLGDLAAGTLVVHRERSERRPLRIEAPPLPPPVPLLVEEQRAVVAFAQRAGYWSSELQREIASHSGGCTHGRDDQRVAQLLGYARWISGDR
jgi:uncharacterized RDD family membrane protein YckC